MEAVAKLKNVPMSGRKMRLVVDLIRGKALDEALNILKFTNKEASEWIEKLLLSAAANWEVKSGNSPEDFGLFVKEIYADEATVLKRFRPAPHGRAHRIRKRQCHVTLVVTNKVALEESVEA